LILTSLVLACGVGLAVWIVGMPRSWTVDYDRARYYEIRRAIDADPRHLLGRPFDEASRRLRLEDVPWDDIAFQSEPGSVRLYHFRGFSLVVTLRSLPAGIPPDRQGPWAPTDEELSRPRVLWLAHQYPVLQIDGVGDRKERMRRLWKLVEEECERINAEMQRKRRTNDRGAEIGADSQSTGP
jgi:hypothetical protein